MKTKIIIIAVFCLFFPLANAQWDWTSGGSDSSTDSESGFEAEFFIGHSILGRGTALGEERKFDNLSKLISERQIYGSAGNGLIYGVNANYFLVDYFGVGVGVSHLSGNWQDHSSYSYTNGYSSTEQFRGNFTSISLDATLRTSCEGPYHGRAFFGPSFFPCSNLLYKRTSGTNGAVDYDIQRTITNRAGFGLNAGFGGDYQVSKRFAVGIDFRSTVFHGAGKNEKYTRYDDKGVDNLPDMNTNEKETVYVDEITQNSNKNGLDGFDKNKPANELRPRTDYNMLSLVLRANFSF